MTLGDLIARYKAAADAAGGDTGAVFNETELARQGRPSSFADLSSADTVRLNRIAQSADVPATALLAVPYEALKGVQQGTGLPVLEAAGRAASAVGIPVALPNQTTSPASMDNVIASLVGARLGLQRAGASTIGALLASVMSGGR